MFDEVNSLIFGELLFWWCFIILHRFDKIAKFTFSIDLGDETKQCRHSYSVVRMDVRQHPAYDTKSLNVVVMVMVMKIGMEMSIVKMILFPIPIVPDRLWRSEQHPADDIRREYDADHLQDVVD